MPGCLIGQLVAAGARPPARVTRVDRALVHVFGRRRRGHPARRPQRQTAAQLCAAQRRVTAAVRWRLSDQSVGARCTLGLPTAMTVERRQLAVIHLVMMVGSFRVQHDARFLATTTFAAQKSRSDSSVDTVFLRVRYQYYSPRFLSSIDLD